VRVMARVAGTALTTGALLAAALVAAGPAYAATPLVDLQTLVAAPAAALPNKLELAIDQNEASFHVNYRMRLDQALNRFDAKILVSVGDAPLEEGYTGYNGSRDYTSVSAGTLTKAQKKALRLAGYPGPGYLALDAPGPSTSVANIVANQTPFGIAEEVAAMALPAEVEELALPTGDTFFRFDDGSVVVDLVVDPSGFFTKAWIDGSTNLTVKVLKRGPAVKVGYPAGYTAVTEPQLDAALAAYPKNLAKFKVGKQAKKTAKKINRWAKKKDTKVTKKIVRKRGSKPIAGYSVTKIAKGVKISRSYLPAGTASRCVVAKQGSAKSAAC
jgi:hypothetical protein